MFPAISTILVAAVSFKITERGKLAQVTLGSGGGKAELLYDGLGGCFLFVGHEN